ncbi:hypothetical protein E3N88_22200 [Mikania micrantha]|uniref:Uncharacterized protein n=1 Tax=Mikania micrantha TaxID=192012 RepID=A0A5N6NAW2_9ASTR|nr:hypothetical protein E3N88_22200 [Mikania micrantha]
MLGTWGARPIVWRLKNRGRQEIKTDCSAHLVRSAQALCGGAVGGKIDFTSLDCIPAKVSQVMTGQALLRLARSAWLDILHHLSDITEQRADEGRTRSRAPVVWGAQTAREDLRPRHRRAPEQTARPHQTSRAICLDFLSSSVFQSSDNRTSTPST